jgi:two-component system cell cycle sensor histidine kinase/response regulator CckA
MPRFDPARALAEVVRKDERRIVRLWSKRLRIELGESQLNGGELRAQLEDLIKELARLLTMRGLDAAMLWPEAVRSHGLLRYSQHYEGEDLAREMKALHEVLLRVYARRKGLVEPEVAELLAELIGEATAAVVTAYARALRTEEIRFREAGVMETILHHVEVGILLSDSEGRLVFATPPSARMLGIPVRMLLAAEDTRQMGQLMQQIDARHPDGRAFRVSSLPYRRVIEERVPVRGVWMEVQQIGGKRRTLELSATPLWEEGEESEALEGVIQTISDRTDLVATSRALSGAAEEVERLQTALGGATRARALEQLASATAHTLSNALNSLKLRLKLMRGEVDDSHLEGLDQTVDGLGALVKRLQEFTEQPTEERPVVVTLVQLVQEAVEVVRPRLVSGANPVDIAMDTKGAEGLRVRVDPGMLREVLYGLALISRDRMREGGTLQIRVHEVEGKGQVQVTDEGGAPSPAECEASFEPFGERHGLTEDPGISLLLAQGRERVQRWGGALHAHPTASGLRMELTLPLISEPDQLPFPSRRALPRTDQPMMVLVVDDDADNATMLASVLGDEGYRVRVANGARTAMRLFSEERFDAALLDAVMPGTSGWELAAELREKQPDLLIAMVTGMDVRGQSRQRLALVDAIFRKPVDIGALDDFLSRAERTSPAAEGPTVHG